MFVRKYEITTVLIKLIQYFSAMVVFEQFGVILTH